MGVNDPNTILQQRRWWRINFLEFFSRKNKVFIKIRNKILCFSVAVWKYQIFFECHFFSRWICFLYVWKLFGMFIRRNKFFQVSSKWITSKPSFQSLKKNERIKATTTTTTSHFSSSSSSSMSTIWIQKKIPEEKRIQKNSFSSSRSIFYIMACRPWMIKMIKFIL